MSDEIHVLVKSNGGGRCLAMYYVDPVSGKRVVKSTGTTDQREAERTAGEWEKQLQRGVGQSPSKITWKQFREKFETEYISGLSKSAKENFQSAFNYVESLLAPDRLCKMTTSAISHFVSLLRKAKMKETTLAGHLRYLKAALRWAERQGMIAKAPTFTMPKQAKGSLAKGRPLVGEEFDRMITACEKIRPRDAEKWKRFLTGLWLSGLRLGESLELSWDYETPFRIDLTGRRPVFVIRAAAQKSRRDEVLPMTPDFAEWLLATYPESERTGKVFGMTGKSQKNGKVVVKIGKAAGVVVNKEDEKFASSHDLRRSFGNRWARKCFPADLQKLMRHADIQTTMAYYVNITPEDIAERLWVAYEQEKNKNGNTCGNTTDKKPCISR